MATPRGCWSATDQWAVVLTEEESYRSALAKSLAEILTFSRTLAAQSSPCLVGKGSKLSPTDKPPVLAAAAVNDSKAAEGDSAC